MAKITTLTVALDRLERMDEQIERLEVNVQKYFDAINLKLDEIVDRERRHQVRDQMANIRQKLKESIEIFREENRKLGQYGRVRVGRIRGQFDKGQKYPITYGYRNIVVTSHASVGSLGAGLSPYILRDPAGRIMENIWQFAKVYASVPEIKTPAWSWKAEIHVKDGKILPAYWKWRMAGMNHQIPVRYPVGFHDRHKCLYALGIDATPENPGDQMKYVEARKKIYVPVYAELAKQSEEFTQLQALLHEGYNLQILDVDGPKPLDGHPILDGKKLLKGIYGESETGSVDINEETIRNLIEITAQAFGHGYVLASCLLNGEEWLV
jgi:hypothetical protein